MITYWQNLNNVLFGIFFLLFGASSLAQDSLSNQSLFPVEQKGRWFFMDKKGEILFENKSFERIQTTFADSLFILKENKRFAVISTGKDTIFDFEFDTIINYAAFLFARNKNHWSIYDARLNQFFSYTADSTHFWKWNFFIYEKGKKGILLRTMEGWKKVDANYDALMPYSHNYYLTYRNNKFGLLSFSGETVLDEVADEVQIDKYGIISYFQNYWKYILPSGEKVDHSATNKVYFYNENFRKVIYPDQKSDIYKSGSATPVLSGYEHYFLLHSGYIAIRNGNKSGLAHADGRIFFQPAFEQVGVINDSVFYYIENQLLGLLSRSGQKLTPAIYSDIVTGRDQLSGYLKVNINGRYGVIDKQGKVKVNPEYDEIGVNQKDFIIEKNDKFGIINEKGVLLSPPVYPDFDYIYDIFYGQTITSTAMKFQLYRMHTNAYSDFYTSEGKLNTSPCFKYTIGNNMIKCYCETGLEILSLDENGKCDAREFYADVVWINTRDTLRDDTRFRINFNSRTAVLHEDQDTEKFTLRLCTEKGYGFPPAFTQVYETKYGGYYSGKIEKDTVVKSIFTHPAVSESFNIFFSDKDGKVYSKDTIISSDMESTSYRTGTSLDFALSKNFKTDFFTQQKPISNVRYIETIAFYLTRFYTGGEMVLNNKSQENFYVWDLFLKYNQQSNFWFGNRNAVKEYMNERNKFELKGGYWRLYHGDRDDYEEFKVYRKFDGSQMFKYLEGNNDGYNFIVSTGGEKYGIRNRFNQTVLPEIYDTIKRIYWNNTQYFAVKTTTDHHVFYSMDLKSDYKSFQKPGPYKDHFAIVKFNNHKGIIDTSGKILSDTLYKSIEHLGKGFFVVSHHGFYRIIHSSGKVHGDSTYQSIKRINEDIILVQKNKRYGWLDDSGNILFDPVFDTLIPLQSGMVYGKSKGVKSVYTSAGLKQRDLLPEEKFKGGFIIRRINKKKFALNNGITEFIIPSTSEPKFIGQLIQIRKGKENIYFNLKGEKLFSVNSSSHLEFSEYRQAIKDKKNWIFLDSALTQFYIGEADEIIDFGFWLKLVKSDSITVINSLGNRINLENNSLPVRKSSENRIVCKSKEGFYYCDIHGKVITDSLFQEARDFKNGYAAVRKNDKWGFINTDGKQVVDFLFLDVSDVSEGKFSATEKSKYGLYSARGENILTHVFNEIHSTGIGIYLKNDVTSGYYLTAGEIIWPKFVSPKE